MGIAGANFRVSEVGEGFQGGNRERNERATFDLSPKRLPFKGSVVYPVAINNVGQIAADYTVPNTFSGPASETGDMHRVVLLQAGGRNGVDIGTLGFRTFAGGLNIWGQLAGDHKCCRILPPTFVYDAPVEVVLDSGGTLTGLDSVIGQSSKPRQSMI